MAFRKQHFVISLCLLLLHSALSVTSSKAHSKEAVKENQDVKKKGEFYGP